MTMPDMQRIGKDSTGFAGRGIYLAGGVSALIVLVYMLGTMVQVMVLGGVPATARECFDLLNSHRLIGLLRLDLPTILIMPLYYVIFFGIYAAFAPAQRKQARFWTILIFVGVTLFFATPPAFSMAALSDKFAAATTDAMRNQLLAAGEAALASETGAIMRGIFLEGAAVAVSVIMLRGSVFGRLAAWTGIVLHGLDLLHILADLAWPGVASALMMAAGIPYVLWFILIARGFFREYRQTAQ